MPFQKKSLTFAVTLLFCGGIQAAGSLQEIDAAQRLLLEQQRNDERQAAERRARQSDVDVRLNATEKSSAVTFPLGETPCFLIQHLNWTADSNFHALLDKGLAQLHPHPVGQCMGTKGVSTLITTLQNSLIEQGFVTTRVMAPPQDLSAGILKLEVITGRVGQIRFDVEPDVDVSGLLATLPLQEGAILNLRDIEQALENLKRVPTAEADIQIEPADQPGWSHLVVKYQQKFPLRLTLSADDSGTRATGRYMGSATISIDNPLKHNDLFYVTQTKSLGGGDPGARGTSSTTVHYSVPVGYWTLALNSNRSNYRQEVAGANQTYIYSGQSETSDIKFSRLVWRDSQYKTTLGMKAWHRGSNNYIDDTEVLVQRRVVAGWEASLNQKAMIGANHYEANLTYKRGTGALGSIASPEDLYGEGTSRLKLLTSDISANVPFSAWQQRWNYASTLRAQVNGTALTPQDRFSIGGRYTVRGFDGESILSSERGWLWRNDLGWLLGDGAQQLYVALDHGEVSGASSDLLVGKTLTGYAFGLKGQSDRANYDIFVGAPWQKADGFRTASYTVGFSLILNF